MEGKDDENARATRNLEERFDKQLDLELKRSDKLRNEMTRLRDQLEQQILLLNENHDGVVKSLQEKLAKAGMDLKDSREQLQNELIKKEALFKAVLKGQEDDYELELAELASKTKSAVDKEQQEKQHLTSAMQLMKFNADRLEKANQDLKARNTVHEQESAKEALKRKQLEVIDNRRLRSFLLKKATVKYNDAMLIPLVSTG